MPMPNVQDLTQKLAMMSDQQMQQYAKTNQEDPYILSLAVSEKNRRAAMRSAAQPQAQQPSVADAEIGSMAAAPMAGLAALPAQNMENMDTMQAAGGGVVGFQRGRMFDVPGMITETTPEVSEALRGREETDAAEEKKLLPAFWEALMSGKTVAEVRGQETPAPERSHPMGSAAAPVGAPPAQGISSVLPDSGAAAQIPSPAGGLAALAARQNQARAPMREEPVAQPAAPSAPRAVAATEKIEAAAKTQDRAGNAMEDARKGAKEVQERQDSLTEADLAMAKEQLAAFDKRSEGAKPVASDREARLRAQEEGLFSEEGQALGNAAMRGFLAILGGTSRNRRVNIARGLAVGLNSFDKRMGQVEQRRAEINKNLDQIETLREQAAAASAEKRDAIEARIDAVRSAGAKASFDLFKSLGYETDMAIGTETFKAAEAERLLDKEQTFEAGEKQKDRNVQTANSIRSANASRAPKEPKSFDVQGKYAEYLMDYEKEAAKSLTPSSRPRMSMAEFARAVGVLPTVQAPPQGAVVLPR